MPKVFCDPALPADYDPAELSRRIDATAERSMAPANIVPGATPLPSIERERRRLRRASLLLSYASRRIKGGK